MATAAAIDADTAEEALGLIKVGYEELPAIFDPLEAMQERAPLAHEDLASYRDGPVPLRRFVLAFDGDPVLGGKVAERAKGSDVVRVWKQPTRHPSLKEIVQGCKSLTRVA